MCWPLSEFWGVSYSAMSPIEWGTHWRMMRSRKRDVFRSSFVPWSEERVPVCLVPDDLHLHSWCPLSVRWASIEVGT